MSLLRRRPALSVIVVVYDMPVQAMNTVVSLSPGHQRGVRAQDYEIVVVENRSPNLLDPAAVQAVAPNVRYLLRDEPGRSPAPAVNAGVRAARGELVAIMVDGARMVTPGVVRNILRAGAIAGDVVVGVPGYHLGEQLHQEAVLAGYDAAVEQAALAALDWRADGYRLFGHAVLSASCAAGFLVPLAESNCVAVTRRTFDAVGGFDTGFITSGGGFVNLDFYRLAVDRPGTTLVVLPGEGTFHQFHGGATTGAPGVDRDELLDEMRAEYERLRGAVHAPPGKQPVLLGEIDPHALPFVALSVRTLLGADAT